MTKESFLHSLANTFDVCLETAKRKNADYAKEADPFNNFRLVEAMGVCDVQTGIMVRLSDKFSRMGNLLKEGAVAQVKDEAVDDTIRDSINYLAILLAYRESVRDL